MTSRDAAPVLASAASMTSVLTESYSAEEEHALRVPSPKRCATANASKVCPGGDERAAKTLEAADRDDRAVSASGEQRQRGRRYR